MSELDRENIRNAITRRSALNPVSWLLRAGFVRPHHATPERLRWPFGWAPWRIWRVLWLRTWGSRSGIFRNEPGVVRDLGTWLPRRWGFYILGFEFGQRG